MSAAETAAPVRLAGNGGLHVVFGAGQVGRVLAALLAERGVKVRVVSRRRPAGLAEGTAWRSANATEGRPLTAATGPEPTKGWLT